MTDLAALDHDTGELIPAALNAALAKAQGEFPPIPRDKTVKVTTKTGGNYSFSYAPLETILSAVRPVLAKHGLALTQLLEDNGHGPGIRTELRHKDGGVLGGTFPLPGTPGSPQELGSLLTYLRRYAITAILGIASEEDDDGQQAADTTMRTQRPKPTANAASTLALADKNDHAVLNIKLKECETKHPTTDQQSWLSALKQWSTGLGFPSTRKEWTKPQVHAAIKHVDGWLEAESIPF